MTINMGSRKVIRINTSELVSLPKQWTRLFDITKGDSVEMEITNERDLLIKPVRYMKND